MDTGFVAGDAVTANYDPMLAKRDRPRTHPRSGGMNTWLSDLRRAGIEGVVTNDSPAAILTEPDFERRGATTTDYLTPHPQVLEPHRRPRPLGAGGFRRCAMSTVLSRRLGWRNAAAA